MNRNIPLAICAVVLFALSLLTWYCGQTRAERFERGQRFLPNLNPDEIAEILITKGEETTHLKRSDDEFLVVSSHGYQAKNEAVNRFISDVLDLSLEKEVGKSDSLAEELEVKPGGEETIEIVFRNAAEKEMVHFFVGKALEGGSGHYLRRVDDDNPRIYLSAKRVFLNTQDSQFLEKQILNVKAEEIESVEGPDFTVKDQEGTLKLSNVPAGKQEKSSEMSKVKSAVSYLNFEEVFLADDPGVADLGFAQALKVDLKDDTGYIVESATKDDAIFIRVKGYSEIERVSISKEESEEELKKKSEILARAEEIEKFNNYHGSWVYKLSDYVGKKFTLSKADLLEDVKKED